MTNAAEFSGITYVRPRGHTQADGSFVCIHRDVTCCDECAANPLIVEVVGQHFYIPNPTERKALIAEMASL